MDISAQEAMELARKVDEACPGLENLGLPLGNLITQVIDEVALTLIDLDALAPGGNFGGPAAVVRMVHGALAHLAEALPPDRKEVQLHRAGRAVGRFMAQKFAEKIREQLGVTDA